MASQVELLFANGMEAGVARLAADGRLFTASDADQDDMVTGQTAFSALAPTFLLYAPAAVVAIPVKVELVQAGTVAGGPVNIVAEIDDVARYSSGGTAETILNNLIGGPAPQCALRSNPTAAAGYGVRIWQELVGADVDPAEGADQALIWEPKWPIFVKSVGAAASAALLIHTWAASTGPTWRWSITWAEIPPAWLS